jgi:hypothetical protein
MWTQIQKNLQTGEVAAANDSGKNTLPFAVPLRKHGAAGALNLGDLAVGQAIRFSPSCPLRPLAGSIAYVLALRQYRFGADVLKNFQLQIGRGKHYFLTIAEDEQGQYLSLSRALGELEQDQWFGRDALGFFMEPSTAKTIRCKADLAVDGDWAAPRYSKTVDWVEGHITQAGGGRLTRSFRYNLLVSESGEKALEIEHDDASGENRVFVTVYRPVEDIASVEAVLTAPEPVDPPLSAPVAPAAMLPAVDDVPLFKDYPGATSSQPKQRPDFRRLEDQKPEEIRIARTAISADFEAEEAANLPSFLVAKDGDYLSLDEVLPPEPERVRVGLKSAQMLIDRALSRNVRVRDVLRDMLGLDSVMSEEVIFELPLSDEDYRLLAVRFKLRADQRTEIRARLENELKRQLGGR